ncbi:hypothetical protein LSAT2_029294 [Lamellibrachia satsuma]|nr:hypothetical protein LSAT2_029294 [Lamellibrachia satsuma]
MSAWSVHGSVVCPVSVVCPCQRGLSMAAWSVLSAWSVHVSVVCPCQRGLSMAAWSVHGSVISLNAESSPVSCYQHASVDIVFNNDACSTSGLRWHFCNQQKSSALSRAKRLEVTRSSSSPWQRASGLTPCFHINVGDIILDPSQRRQFCFAKMTSRAQFYRRKWWTKEALKRWTACRGLKTTTIERLSMLVTKSEGIAK